MHIRPTKSFTCWQYTSTLSSFFPRGILSKTSVFFRHSRPPADTLRDCRNRHHSAMSIGTVHPNPLRGHLRHSPVDVAQVLAGDLDTLLHGLLTLTNPNTRVVAVK